MELVTLTDRGMSRTENQDNFWSVIANVDDVETGVICLCDGMGGLKNGREASRIVVQGVRDFIKQDFEFDNVMSVLEESNVKVNSIGGSDRSSMMGTTCSLLIAYDGLYRVYHVGDSRVYLIRGGKAYRITEDHSAVVALKIDKNKEPEKYAKYRSKLTRCIGAKPTVKIEYYTGKYIDGDIFLVCSDGVWHTIEDDVDMTQSISDLQKLFNRCISEGETDNLTACVLKI